MSCPPYQDRALAPEHRARDLLSRMTLPEKIGQMMMLDGRGDLRELVQERLAGSLLHLNGERAGSAISLALRTRLAIPLLMADDCIHGHSFWPGATIFGSQLAQACSWNEELVGKAARATAREVAATGIRWTFSPVLCLARDLRWGRIGETFGEDPLLAARLGAAMARGYQGHGLDDPNAILATAKHFAGYSETQGGRDATEADLSPRKLRTHFLPPFEAALQAGCWTVMTSHASLDGLPCAVNPWLLRKVLREELGFQGLLVTDWDSLGRLVHKQCVAADLAEAAALAVRGGIDLVMATPGFLEGCQEALERGLLEESAIDSIVERILLLKFRMGLFENPGNTESAGQQCIGCEAHRELNLELARESIVLLQNRDHFLPLPTHKPLRIALIGPNADNDQMHLGDWAGGSGQMPIEESRQPRELTVTLRDGLEQFAPPAWILEYARGCGIREEKSKLLDPALQIAREADVIVAVVGDDLSLAGEGKPTATLELRGGQVRLLEKLSELGKPLVLALVHSKPCVLPACVHNAAAILECFSPGMMGGRAFAEILSGAVNPSGRLPLSVPYHVGQLPVHYAQARGQLGDRYADHTQSPHFAFGEGLSFSDFRLSELTLSPASVAREETVTVEATLHNDGERTGRCVVQLYVSDLVTSATWVQKELKDFHKPLLQPGESTRVRFELPASACSIVDAQGHRRVEPGEFEVEVALSSRDPHALKARFSVVS